MKFCNFAILFKIIIILFIAKFIKNSIVLNLLTITKKCCFRPHCAYHRQAFQAALFMSLNIKFHLRFL